MSGLPQGIRLCRPLDPLPAPLPELRFCHPSTCPQAKHPYRIAWCLRATIPAPESALRRTGSAPASRNHREAPGGAADGILDGREVLPGWKLKLKDWLDKVPRKMDERSVLQFKDERFYWPRSDPVEAAAWLRNKAERHRGSWMSSSRNSVIEDCRRFRRPFAPVLSEQLSRLLPSRVERRANHVHHRLIVPLESLAGGQDIRLAAAVAGVIRTASHGACARL
jgi:hypothetical protein